MEQASTFYDSTSGDIEHISKLKHDEIKDNADLFNVNSIKPDKIKSYPNIILGSSAWDISEIQNDMEYFFHDIDFHTSGQNRIALFALGNQQFYPNSFMNSMGHMYDKLYAMDATIVGKCSNEGYGFNKSKAFQDNQFFGLPHDNEMDEKLTRQKIKSWVKQHKGEFI